MIGIVMAGGRGSRMSVASGRRAGRHGSKEEKLLLPIRPRGKRAKPVVCHVIDSLAGASIIDEIIALTSPIHAPHTRDVLQSTYADDPAVRIADSDGAGYSKDLDKAIRDILASLGPAEAGASSAEEAGSDGGEEPDGESESAGRKCVMVVSGDMPLLDSQVVRTISSRHAGGAWTSIMIPKSYARMWGMNLEYSKVVDGTHCFYTGVSMVGLDRSIPLGDMPRRHVILEDHRIAFTLNTAADYKRLRSFGL